MGLESSRRFGKRHGPAADRLNERRRREDDAPRLIERVPRLESLRLEIQELRAGATALGSAHIRLIPVSQAPALFELPCTDSFCKDGVHDLTYDILRALESGAKKFQGEDACSGHTGSADCQRVLQYMAVATYRS
jgi:hypothetical protein